MLNNKGQTAVPEHVVTFFIVVAALAAMGVYLQRGMQARVHDARNYMVKTASEACDQDCKRAAEADGKKIPVTTVIGVTPITIQVPVAGEYGDLRKEYEPYYTTTNAQVQRDAGEDLRLYSPGIGTDGIVRKENGEAVVMQTQSAQQPPKDAK